MSAALTLARDAAPASPRPRETIARVAPRVARLSRVYVDIREGGPGTDQLPLHRQFCLPPASSFHVGCSDPECLYGGFDVRSIVDEMLERGEVESLCVEVCDGVKRRGRFNWNYVRCQYLFRVYLRIE